MPIALSNNLARPKAAQTVAVPISVTVLNPAENDGNDNFVQYIQIDNITPQAFDVSCDASNGATELTSNDASADIRVGDVVSGTGIAGGTVVTAVSGTTITIDQATTQALTAETLTFTPPETDAKLIGMQGDFSISGNNLVLRLRSYSGDGSTVIGPTDSSTISDFGAADNDITLRVNLDEFLTNMRYTRTNS